MSGADLTARRRDLELAREFHVDVGSRSVPARHASYLEPNGRALTAIPQLASSFIFFFNDTATTEIYTLSLHDALPICCSRACWSGCRSTACNSFPDFMARRLTRLILFFALTATASRAQSPAVPTQRVLPDDRPFSTRVSGIFENDLPQLDPPGAVKFILRPHLGDLIHRDYMRLETGLTLALSDDFEIGRASCRERV